MTNEAAMNLRSKPEETLPGGGVCEYEETRKTRKTIVYIAMVCSDGERLPMTDRWKNAIDAIEVAQQLWEDGYFPICPHLTVFWDSLCGRSYKTAMEYDRVLLDFSDCVFRGKRKSGGADEEMEYAKEKGKPVFTSYGELLEKMAREIQI